MPGVNPLTGRPGPAPNPPRDGDKIQARQRVNVEVRTGRRPHPNTLPCTDCGHVWRPGERRHHYDHHLGYAAEHHLDVEPVCTTCHAARDQKPRTHCRRGHRLSAKNVLRETNGARRCRTCRTAYATKRMAERKRARRRMRAERARRVHGRRA